MKLCSRLYYLSNIVIIAFYFVNIRSAKEDKADSATDEINKKEQTEETDTKTTDPAASDPEAVGGEPTTIWTYIPIWKTGEDGKPSTDNGLNGLGLAVVGIFILFLVLIVLGVVLGLCKKKNSADEHENEPENNNK